MIGFGFAGESGDYVRADSGVGQKFADEADAASVMLSAIPAVHGGQNIVRAGLQRHVEMASDAIGAGEKGDEVLRYVEWLDGTDTEARERRFIENAMKKIENVGAWRKISAPGAEIDTAQNDFLKAGIAEAADFSENGFGRKAAAFAADEGDNAKGTAIVAAILNFENRASVIPFPAEDGCNEDLRLIEDVAEEKTGR
jgi:hypothetical protein